MVSQFLERANGRVLRNKSHAGAYHRGEEDFGRGVERDACPYSRQNIHRLHWLNGWDDAAAKPKGE